MERINSILRGIPYVKGLYEENRALKRNTFFHPRDFYSAIVSVDEIRQRQDEIWLNEKIDGIDGLNLNVDKQIQTVRRFEEYYADIPFPERKVEDFRYYFENGFYSYTDAIFLYSMMRHFRPKRIVEMGSGFSSALMLDTNELFFKDSIGLTFIEPYPERLKSLLKPKDANSTTIIEKRVQDVSLETFDDLGPGDFLFIDSTHVSKTGSDVNHIIFQILPRLSPGVMIHFHDIFYPFEYPRKWVYEGRSWNENYIVKAFLMYNEQFEIRLFSDYLHRFHRELFSEMPLCYKNNGGNLWIEKRLLPA